MAKSYLGTGIKNPPVVTGLGRISLESDKALIEQSIIDRLNTPRGSEFFNRQNGSILNRLIHQPNDSVLVDLLDFHIQETIETQERRVKYIKTEFLQDINREDLIHCNIKVLILQSSEQHSFVYPFYKEIES